MPGSGADRDGVDDGAGEGVGVASFRDFVFELCDGCGIGLGRLAGAKARDFVGELGILEITRIDPLFELIDFTPYRAM